MIAKGKSKSKYWVNKYDWLIYSATIKSLNTYTRIPQITAPTRGKSNINAIVIKTAWYANILDVLNPSKRSSATTTTVNTRRRIGVIVEQGKRNISIDWVQFENQTIKNIGFFY